MRASRLLSMLMYLQARGRVSATRMARDLEVSVRTIHRDIDHLCAAGIPITADRGRSGGFQLLAGYRVQLAGLTESEAETLFFSGLPGPAAELGLTHLMAAARTKLSAILPEGMRAERIASRFHLDPTSWFQAAEPAPHLPTIAQAVWNARQIDIRYATNQTVVSMTLGPAGLVLKAGIWYLVAQKASGKFRTYRVDRIRGATLRDEPYRCPSDFRLATYWKESTREYELGLYRHTIKIRLSAAGLKLIPQLGHHVERAVAKTSRKPDKSGWTSCSIPIEDGDCGLRELLRLGPEVEVMAPKRIRSRMAKLLEVSLAKYGLPGSGR